MICIANCLLHVEQNRTEYNSALFVEYFSQLSDIQKNHNFEYPLALALSLKTQSKFIYYLSFVCPIYLPHTP